MPRAGITREQVFETADGLVREGQNPTALTLIGVDPPVLRKMDPPSIGRPRMWRT
jgi:hypothetical protein